MVVTKYKKKVINSNSDYLAVAFILALSWFGGFLFPDFVYFTNSEVMPTENFMGFLLSLFGLVFLCFFIYMWFEGRKVYYVRIRGKK